MINVPFHPDVIPVVFSSNDYFVPYMSVNMQSIMENAKNDKRYCFFILYRNLSNEYVNLLRKQISIYDNFSIYFLNVSEYFDGVNLFTSRHITVETYFRLLIPFIFLEYQKVLYLDGDMVCLTDISALFDINLENYLLAVVGDPDVAGHYCAEDSEYLKNHIVLPNLKYPLKYFNSGLNLYNNVLFRDSISWNEIIKVSTSQKYHYHDNDVLNLLTNEQTLILPYHWNLTYTNKSEYLPENFLNEYLDAKKNPKIIHFTYKPWDRENYIPFFEYFWKYATRTPFIDVIMDRMKNKGFISYGSFNERILFNISHRNGIGLRFILVDCIKAWLFRNKK